MDSNDDGVIDAEIVESDNLPALVEAPKKGPSARYAAGERDFDRTNRSLEPIKPDGRTWRQGPTPDRRCRAHKKTGEQCKNAALQGSTVCRYHGGAAKHVKAAAKARLENAADLMAKNLLGLALTDESGSVRLGATNSALDRVGLTKPTEVVLSQGATAPYEEIFEGISTMTREESRAARGLVGDSPTEAGSYDAGNTEQQWSEPEPALVDYESEPSRRQEATGAGGFDSQGPQSAAVTGWEAIEAANTARELPGGHRRYPAP